MADKKSARMLLPNMLTLIGVCIGLTSIRFALDGRFELAIIAIMFAALIDGLDGRIARLIKGTSKVGKELDSLTDMISFGVAIASPTGLEVNSIIPIADTPIILNATQIPEPKKNNKTLIKKIVKNISAIYLFFILRINW
ncbi:CDP-alcohol phosphatidyltransferase family protein [Candidatus Pelagibacter sp.]|nr:CDP-alcohol phosphatidyltransferase family protein [Candidatus Pelagibacter sp.]